MSTDANVKLAPKQYAKDKEFADAMHGKDATEYTGMSAYLHKNNDAAQVAVDGYLKHFDGKTDEAAETERRSDYSDLVKHYYNVATDFYEYGWGSSFHFSTFYPGEPFRQSIARHEHYLAAKLGLKEGMKVLDVGCGVGGPAREICHFTHCNIVGLNNNDYQVERANHFADIEKMADKLHFVKGDFMQMDFEDNSFDSVYAIEATVHAPTLEGVYSEIYRVLKPGALFGVYEWVMTDKYDENNEEHRKIAYGIEVGDGIPKMYPLKVAVEALENVGFEIEYQRDLADNDDEVPWYYPLAGEWRHIQSLKDLGTYFRTSWLGRTVTSTFVSTLETLGLAPKGSSKVTEALEQAAIYLVKGGEQKLFTPMQLFIARKPLDAKSAVKAAAKKATK